MYCLFENTNMNKKHKTQKRHSQQFDNFPNDREFLLIKQNLSTSRNSPDIQ